MNMLESLELMSKAVDLELQALRDAGHDVDTPMIDQILAREAKSKGITLEELKASKEAEFMAKAVEGQCGDTTFLYIP